MNIRKIIKEEMDGFDWMKNANTLSYEYLVGKAIEFDPMIQDMDYFKYVLGILEGLGFILSDPLKNPETFFDWERYPNDGLVGLFMNTNGHIVYTSEIYEGYDEHIADYLGTSIGEIEILNGRELFKNYVKEDFDWAESWVEDTPNVGDEYYWDYGMGNGPVLIRVIGIINSPGKEPTVRFKVMDRNFLDDNPEMFYDEDYGWDPTDSIGLEGFMDMAKKDMNEDFDWVEKVEPNYWNPEDNPLKVGDCIIDKLDSTSTKWTIKSFGQSLGGTPIIEVEDDVYSLITKTLNRELFEKDLVKGRYSFCGDFIKEDFDWVEEHNPIEYLVDKAFYFDPPVDGAEPDSEEVKAYNKICQLVVENGGQSVYSTPTTIEPDEDLVHGLYVYTDKNSGELSFCFTPGIDEEESYEIHIKEFAKNEAENPNIQVVDAVEFVKSL